MLDLPATTQAKHLSILKEHLRPRYDARRLDGLAADDLARLVRDLRSDGMTKMLPGVRREDLAPAQDPDDRAVERNRIVDILFDLEADSRRAIQAFPVAREAAIDDGSTFVGSALREGMSLLRGGP